MANELQKYMISELQKNMPNRTLNLSNVGDGGLNTQLSLLIPGILVAIALIYGAFTLTQGILQDRKMIDNWVSVPTAELSSNSKCSTRKFISSCNVTIRNNGETIQRSFHFVDFRSGNYTVDVIAQKDNLSNMNVDLAIDRMGKRMMTVVGMAIIAIIALFWSISVFRTIPAKQRLKNIMNDPVNQPWQFVVVPATLDGKKVTYTTEVDDNSMELVLDFKGREPIILGKKDNQSAVLGIRAKSLGSTIVLCKKLKKIDFISSEKRPLLAIIR